MNQLEVRRVIDADADTVWAAVTDHESMARWSALKSVWLRVEGSPDRNGLGAVRVMKGPGATLQEEVVGWDPPHAYDYRLTAGAPMRDHEGRVVLRPLGDSTEVAWSVRFRPAIWGTGWVLEAVLRAAIGDMLRRLARELER